MFHNEFETGELKLTRSPRAFLRTSSITLHTPSGAVLYWNSVAQEFTPLPFEYASKHVAEETFGLLQSVQKVCRERSRIEIVYKKSLDEALSGWANSTRMLQDSIAENHKHITQFEQFSARLVRPTP